MSNFGRFEGNVVARWLTHGGDDRDMQLLEEFVFTDPDGKRWIAPEGSIVNGASIPAVLWSSIGPPFVGDYRRASVIHDVACEERREPHDEVHLVFYNAMRADGVGWLKANAMYQAVKRFGPTWNMETGASTPTRSPSVEEMESFLAAVNQAAEEIGDGGNLDEVERRADQIITTGYVSRPPISPNSKIRRSQQQTLNRLTPRKKAARRTRNSSSKQIPLFAKVKDATKHQLANTVDLPTFRSTTHELSKQDRLLVVDQALVLIEQNYVHLQLKEAMHAVDPVQRLRLLRRQLDQTLDENLENASRFHHELAAIFLSVRDLHTNYFLPDPIAGKIAFVPFMVEAFFEEEEVDEQRRFLVTRVFTGFQEPPFASGVEIIRWNGIPIERAVEINGDRFAGSNQEARRARGIETLTVRSLVQSLPPDEDFVIVEYRTENGHVHELRVPWFIFSPDTSRVAGLGEMPEDLAMAQGVDVEQTLVRLAKKVLFAPDVVAEEAKMARRKAPAKNQGLVSMMPDVLEARLVETDTGELGYVRIWTFSVQSAENFVAEFIRLVEQLPKNGLLIDVRGNGGGLITAGEQLLQVLTPHRIEPTLFQLRNTPLNLRLAERTGFLAQWRTSMRQALLTGAAYSAGFPITNPGTANNIGQRYHGPVVLITDALCYSTTDIFAAGFQDHKIGPILGIDANMGAGGANVWGHDLLQWLMPEENSPYRSLPDNAGMRVSMRRTIRVGESSGTVLEDLGVVPNKIHRMTRDDLLRGNPDLIAAAADLLANLPKRRLEIRFGNANDEEQDVIADCLGFDRLDTYVNERPIGSIDVDEGENSFTMPLTGRATVDFHGFANGELVASRRVLF